VRSGSRHVRSSILSDGGRRASGNPHHECHRPLLQFELGDGLRPYVQQLSANNNLTTFEWDPITLTSTRGPATPGGRQLAVTQPRSFALFVAVLMSVTACNSSQTPIALGEFDADDLVLPVEYQRYDEESSAVETIGLDWSAWRSGAPTEDNCPDEGDGVVWHWTDNPDAAGQGDPDVRLYLCDAGDPDLARDVFEATPLERTVFVLTSTPEVVDTEGLGLAADESRMACVTFDENRCSAWAFLARYGRLLVTLTFESGVKWVNLDEDEFTRLAVDVDALVSDALDASPIPAPE